MRWVAGFGLAFGLVPGVAAAPPGVAEDSAPFATRLHAIRGRIVQVWPLSVATCPDGSGDLLVLSIEGGPPTQKRFATWMPCGSALRPGDPSIRVLTIPAPAVLVDVARVPGRAGPQLISISATGLRVESLADREPPAEHPIAGGLPLPSRPWEIGRVPIVEAWNDDGRLLALVPATSGAWLYDFERAEARRIEMPIYASYESFMPFLPETVSNWIVQEVSWPALARGDDDGDGRRDLFALSRWNIAIYHAGPKGLPSRATRGLELVPFDEKAEQRHRATAQTYSVRDLDGDTRADLILNTIEGGLMSGRSTTRIHLNPGQGVRLEAAPTVLRETKGGFSGVEFVDLEGDGRLEILETNFEFGILQLVRLLATRKAETTVRILALDATAPGGVRTLFEDGLVLGLDFEESRLAGILPGMGDWNGDGLLDLFVARGDEAIGFRLGLPAGASARFAAATGRQAIPLASGATRSVDLDGDGLDDLVAFTTTEADPPLIVLENLGRLPGTKSGLRSR